MKIHKKSNDYTLLLKKYIYKNAAYAFTRFPTFQAKKKNLTILWVSGDGMPSSCNSSCSRRFTSLTGHDGSSCMLSCPWRVETRTSIMLDDSVSHATATVLAQYSIPLHFLPMRTHSFADSYIYDLNEGRRDSD